MIQIRRLECPDILSRDAFPESEGIIEAKEAIAFYGDPNNHHSKFQRNGNRGQRIQKSYSVYSEDSVRGVLKKMFHGKCAYCESKITSVYNGDIEHFRPKAGYCNDNSQPLIKPGYYWLASEWENLLFACPFCNQTNTHEIIDGGSIHEVVQGKLNQFPLRDVRHRLTTNHGQIYFLNQNSYTLAFDQEEAERLLLKPCTDEVEKHFKYSEDGLILENDGLSLIERERAKTSIKVYALQRLGLVQSREEKIIQIKAQIRRVEQAIENLNRHFEDSDEEKIWFEGILREEMKILKRFKDSDQEYAGMARFFIDNYFYLLT